MSTLVIELGMLIGYGVIVLLIVYGVDYWLTQDINKRHRKAIAELNADHQRRMDEINRRKNGI